MTQAYRNIYYENPLNLIYWIVLKSRYKSIKEWYIANVLNLPSGAEHSEAVQKSIDIMEEYCPEVKKLLKP